MEVITYTCTQCGAKYEEIFNLKYHDYLCPVCMKEEKLKNKRIRKIGLTIQEKQILNKINKLKNGEVYTIDESR